MRYIIGIDEVGRGPLAGPVMVAAVLMPASWRAAKKDGLGKLRDSKKMSAAGRVRWFEYFKGHPDIAYAISRVYPRRIERMNVSRAANSAALAAFKRLISYRGSNSSDCTVYLDGGLYLGNGKKRLPGITMIKADEKITAVMAASIMAKVHRDRIMVRAAKNYPGYGFEKHKGYGTPEHLKAIRRLGPAKIHRLTFVS